MELIKEWRTAKNALDAWKNHENQLRIRIHNELFDGVNDGRSHYYKIGDLTLTLKSKLNYTVDDTVLGEVNYKMQSMFQNGQCLMEALFKGKWNLVIGEYNQLSPEHRAIVDLCLISKPGLPILDIK